jgi:hypothetical protein
MCFVALLIKMKLLPEIGNQAGGLIKRREGSSVSWREHDASEKTPESESECHEGQNALEDEYIVRHILRRMRMRRR